MRKWRENESNSMAIMHTCSRQTGCNKNGRGFPAVTKNRAPSLRNGARDAKRFFKKEIYRPLEARLEAFRGFTLAAAAMVARWCVQKLQVPMDHLAEGMG